MRSTAGSGIRSGVGRGGRDWSSDVCSSDLDVFLASVSGNSLGGACLWKECGPGIRQSCDALHCGQRHYLHDDLRALTLESTLIQAPPIELWPVVLARVEVPADEEEVLLKPIQIGRA